MQYYEVAPLKIVRATSTVFTYAYAASLQLGTVVTIPVGKQTLVGLVIKNVTKPAYDTKQVATILDIPPIPAELLATALWMSDYYATHLATVLQTILPRGITKKRRQKPSDNTPVASRKRTNFVFNKSQQNALTRIEQSSPGTVLLHGITGSGKTAVYIETARRVIASGRSAILLVPEISLTAQLVAEFQLHFPSILLTHSKQTEAERHRAWHAALTAKDPIIAIGPRSALFLPIASIGAIIIDEAHEPSFKQDQSPRYSALRVASVLGHKHHAHIIQGSATPLISEYYLAQHANRPIIEMTELAHVDAIPPSVTIVDMTKKSSFSRHRFLSNELLERLEETLAAGHQALIFHNRRGSASTTLCTVCGWSAMCSRCFVPLTLHADQHTLRCHICAAVQPVPTSCPTCHETDIVHKGIGTKLIETELRRLFPKATIARFDGDTADDNTVEQRYQALYDGDIDIIIGTQVIAKGLDLPHLRTVGVIQADAGLSLPDFAAAERTFQLLAQVVGRVGRSAQTTTVVVQSYQPNAEAVRDGLAQNYSHFYKSTLAERHRGLFPPFVHLLRLICVYKTEAAAIRNAQALAHALRHEFTDVTIFGPTPAFYERQHDTYRWQLIIKSSHRARLLEIIAQLPAAHWQFDIDPASLL